MKKSILKLATSLVCVAVSTTAILAQNGDAKTETPSKSESIEITIDKKPKKEVRHRDHIFKMDVVNWFNMSYENKIGRDASLLVSGGVFEKTRGFSYTRPQNWQLDLSYRRYFGKDNDLEGIYLGPLVRYSEQNYVLSSNNEQFYRYQTAGLGLTVGYQLVTCGGFTLDANYKTTYNPYINRTNGSTVLGDNTIEGNPRRYGQWGLSLGYAF